MLIDVVDLKLALHGEPILKGVNLQMQPGEIYGLLGPNGAGKSTSLSVLTGLRAPSSGKVTILGYDPGQQRVELHRLIGVLSEQGGFYGWMNATDYLQWFARLYGVKLNVDQVVSRLAQVGLDPTNREPIAHYSRGMQQRLGLARALMNDPKLLILDEPTSGLDPRGRREIHDILLDLAQRHNVGILLCTHLLDDVDRLCSRIGVIHQGRTLLEGNLAELLASQQAGSRYRLRLLAASPDNALPAGVKVLSHEGEWVHLELVADEHPDAVWGRLLKAGWPIAEIHKEGGGLEELYFNMTQMEVMA